MFVESINMTDVLLEGFKVIITMALILILLQAGKRFPQLSGGSWRLIILGFIAMFIGFLFDWSDELINYELNPFAEQIEGFIEEGFLIGGLILVTLGFKNWFNFIGRILGLKSK